MVTGEDILKLKIYCQSITRAPHPFEQQPHARMGEWMWCEDWELIELLKCMFHGEQVYRDDPPPNRLRGNPLFKQEEIITQARELVRTYGSADRIIEHLQARRAAHVVQS